MSVANKDEALRCLDKARNYLAAGNTAKAKHFADKAKNLYACPEVDDFHRYMQSSGSGASSASPRSTPAPQQSGGPSGNAAGTSRNGTAATPAQQEIIARIRRSKGDYYKVLGVDRSADEDEIKKSYRKLALKLHPDKCQAPGAEEAFKEVSKAFTCLTDQDKRAFYDRTGHEDMASAAAARAGGGHGPQFRGDHIDPQDLFNMMFGGGMNGAFGMGPMHFGGFQQHPGYRQQRRQAPQQANPMAGLVSVIFPIVLLLLTLLMNTSSPPAAMSYSREYRHQIRTAERDVPYFVRDVKRFEDTYPAASRQRQKFERSIESEYQDELKRTCHMEMVHEEERQRRHKRRNRGQPAPPKALPSCDRMVAFRSQHSQSPYHGKVSKHGQPPPDNIIQHDEF